MGWKRSRKDEQGGGSAEGWPRDDSVVGKAGVSGRGSGMECSA